MNNYSIQNLNFAELRAKPQFFDKFKISYNINALMDFTQLWSQTPLKIDLIINNDLARPFEISSS